MPREGEIMVREKLSDYEAKVLGEMKLSEKAKRLIEEIWKEYDEQAPVRWTTKKAVLPMVAIMLVLMANKFIYEIPVLVFISVCAIWVTYLSAIAAATIQSIIALRRIERLNSAIPFKLDAMVLWKGMGRIEGFLWCAARLALAAILAASGYVITGIFSLAAWTILQFWIIRWKRVIQKAIDEIS